MTEKHGQRRDIDGIVSGRYFASGCDRPDVLRVGSQVSQHDEPWIRELVDSDSEVSEAEVAETRKLLRETAVQPTTDVQTHAFPSKDLRIRTHPLILEWLDKQLPNTVGGRNARYEILLLVLQAQRLGVFLGNDL